MTAETDRIAALEKKVSDLQDRLDWALIAARALLLRGAPSSSEYQRLTRYLNKSLSDSFKEQGVPFTVEDAE